ncbi:hypothetical protein E1287_14370 [Actinomadura sp. KC06]|uniref:hypothetical protein n=1 Tax=Actinomadura sp. KC06 TaxID=2530369 RepID=UPI001047A327|nr:hypothetical protein [Actinomadura sp. KC06]TDD35287.1 hypothetical protein E1287_14370 [Actinomadura sp. KC06]
MVAWWSFIILLGVFAWQSGRPEVGLLPILGWSYYQLFSAPKLCGVETTRGHPCKNRAYGRLMACKNEPSHDIYKRDAFLRLLGVHRGGRPITAPASHERTPRASTESHTNASPPATVEARQQALAMLTIALTLIGTAATVVQTVLTA